MNRIVIDRPPRRPGRRHARTATPAARGKAVMKTIAQTAFAIVALFGLAACGGGGGGGGGGGSTDWRQGFVGGWSLVWDRRDFAWNDRRETVGGFSVSFPLSRSYTWSGDAWGAIAGDAAPEEGRGHIAIGVGETRMFFGFEFLNSRLNPPLGQRITREASTSWDDSAGSGEFHNALPLGTDDEIVPYTAYGVQIYDNARGQQVQAAYQFSLDD